VSVNFSFWLKKTTFISRFIWDRLIEFVRLLLLKLSTETLHGPCYVSVDPTEAVVLCVVKDGGNLAGAFIEHYLSIGFKHIFFLDNGSTDNTVSIIKGYSNTTVVRSLKPFCKYYVVFKNYLIQEFGNSKWCLVADIDEFLQLPLERSLKKTLNYLNTNNYDIVCTQMLDMFSKDGIALQERCNRWSLAQLKDIFCYYDLSGISQRPYVRSFQSNIPAGLMFLYGGIRKTIFGRNCFLTKEALFYVHDRPSLGLWRLLTQLRYLQSSHLLMSTPFTSLRLADFSALFIHYKFIDSFYASTQKAVATENHWKNSQEYKAYNQVMLEEKNKQKTLDLRQSNSVVLKETNQLINQEFLFVSKAFRQGRDSLL